MGTGVTGPTVKSNGISEITKQTGYAPSVGLNRSINAGWEWTINNKHFTNAAIETVTVPLCADGMQRIDMTVLQNNGKLARVPGIEDAENPQTPAKPNNSLFVSFIYVNDTEASEMEFPILGDIYRQKIEAGTQRDGVGTDIIEAYLLNGEKSTIELIGDILEIHSFDIVRWNPYDGKVLTIINNQGIDVTLRSLTGTATPIICVGGGDLIIKANTITHLKYNEFDDCFLGTSTTDVKLPLSAFLDIVNGSDIGGRIENASRPFKSMEALIYALPATLGETYTIYFTGGTIPIMRRMPTRNFRFIAYTPTTLDFTNCKENDGVTEATECLIPSATNVTWTFENENISISCNYVGFKGLLNPDNFNIKKYVIFKGVIDILDWRSYSLAGAPNKGFVTAAGSDLVINRLQDSAQARANMFPIGEQRILIRTYGTILKNDTFRGAGGSVNSEFEVRETTQANNNYRRMSILGGTNGKLKLGNITHTGVIEPDSSEVIFNGKLSDDCSIDYVGVPKIQGVVDSLLPGTNAYGNAAQLFQNFKGKLNKLQQATAGATFTFDNCDIEVNDFLIEKGANRQDILFFKGSNSITQTDTSANLVRVSPLSPLIEPKVTLTISGPVSSNMLSYGSNATSIYTANTFKEKKNDITIRSKKDLTNRTLVAGINYIVDTNIQLVAGDFILISGKVTISGSGIDVSGIFKDVPGEAIIKGANAENLIMKDITISSGQGFVFDLEDIDGTHALEFNDVNFSGCASLGKLKGFRQFTGQTIGMYSVKDGLQISGTWNGFSITKLHARNFGIADVVSTIFKRDADTHFNGRFFAESNNIDFKNDGSFSDFISGDFDFEKLFKIESGTFSRNGVVDDTQNYMGTIEATDDVADWQGTGFPNSPLKPYGFDTTRLEIYVDDAAAAADGLGIRHAYIEAATGYIKARLV